MAIVSLMRLPTTPREGWAFVFEHDQVHRKQSPKHIGQFDPMRNVSRPGSKWHLDHQQAHNEMATGQLSVQSWILADSNLFNLKQKTWWEFVNHQDHLTFG